MERSFMMLRAWWLVLAVLGCAGLTDAARAQPAPEGPPVPPETESAVSGRAAAGGGKGGAALGGGAAAPSSDVKAEEALRAFSPAPPPLEPGPPAQPTSALTSFAPAPAPPPGGAPKSAPQAPPVPPLAATDGTGSEKQETAEATETSAPVGPAADSGESSAETIAYAPRGDERWSASALAGVGVTFDNTTAGVNPLGFGFGVRADYRVLPELSLGARMLYFVGGSVELPTSDLAMQSWLIAAEGAYVIQLEQVLIQPGIALGLHVREIDYRGFAGVVGGPEMLIPPDRTRLALYVAPGVNFAVPLGLASPSLAPLIVGADVRLDLAFGASVTSNIQLLVLAGFQF